MANETNSFSLNRKTQYLAAAVNDNVPYIQASRSYLKDKVDGKKCGMTYNFYFPDPGKAYAGTSEVDITNDLKTITEREVSCTLMNARTSVDLGTWERLTEIEDFVNEVAEPRGQTLATEIEIDSINRGWKVSDGAKVINANELGMDDLAGLAASLKAIRSRGKFRGFAHPAFFHSLGAKNLSLFLPSDIMREIYRSAFIGNYMDVDWVSETYMPTLSVTGAQTAANVTAIGADGISITGTNLYVGMMFTLSGVEAKCTDMFGRRTAEDKVFIVESVNEAGTAGKLSQKITCSVGNASEATAVQTNCNTYGSFTAICTAGLTAKTLLTATGDYTIIQARDADALEWDTYKHPKLDGCTESTQRVGKITAQVAKWANVYTRQQIVRVDVPYISQMIDGRRSRLLVVKLP